MRVILIALFLTVVSASAFAQSNQGSIAGTIFDRLGRMVENAPVAATNIDTARSIAPKATARAPGDCPCRPGPTSFRLRSPA